MSDGILDVDLLAFEQGDAAARDAVVDGVMRSLRHGFVYTANDLSSALLDDAYGKLDAFFALDQDRKQQWVADGTHGQRGYTGLLVETAAVNDVPMLQKAVGGALESASSQRFQKCLRYLHLFAHLTGHLKLE